MSKKIKQFLMMNIGVILLSVEIYFFKIPNGFSTGGVTGIATVLGQLNILSPSQWIMIFNVVFLIIGMIFLGKEIGIKTIYCSVMYSAIIYVLEILVPLDKPITDQPFLELAYAILLGSIASAIIFNCMASTGGTDIAALLLRKSFPMLDVGKALLVTDFFSVVCVFFVFDIKTGLYSLLGLFAKAFLVDGIIENLNTFKYFIVITSNPEEISKFIISSLNHGVTVNKATGEYTGTEKTMIHTVCRRIEAIKLKRKIKEIDPNAFIIVTTSSEIIGRGFRSV